jgi:hypothetical protein
LAVTWTTQRTGDWSLPSDNASSPWHDGGTQTGYARTPGSSANANDDLVVIANGHTLTCDASVTIGDDGNPTTATSITNASGGTGLLSVSTGVTLTLTSKAQNRGTATWTFTAGSHLVLTYSTATTWTTGETLNACKIVFAGSSGSRCSVTSTTVGNARFTYTGGAATTASNIEASYTDFVGLGDSSNAAFFLYGGSSTTHLMTFDHCTFDQCGPVQFANCSASGTMSLDSCTWTNGTHTRSIIPIATQARTSGVRLINNCALDKILGNSTSLLGWTLTGNVFADDISILASAAIPWDEWSNCATWIKASAGRNCAGEFKTSLGWNLFNLHDTTQQLANIRFLNLGIYNTGTIEWSGLILDPGNTGNEGDCINTGAMTATTTWTLKNNILLPNSSGLKCGKLVSCLAPQTNLTIKFVHNTYVTDGQGETGFQYGESYSGKPDMVSEFYSNLGWSYTSNNGVLVQMLATSTTGTTVSATNGSPTVTGTSTKFSTGDGSGPTQVKLAAGYFVRFGSETVAYEVQSVDSDTQITLTTNYAGTTGGGKAWNPIVQDVITPAACDCNAMWNGYTGTDGVGYNSVYSFLDLFSTAVGSHDVAVSADPFVDKTRNGVGYAVSVGAASSGDSYNTKIAALYTYLAADPAVRVAACIAWIKDGWRVTDATLNNAGHDSTTIGALDYYSTGGGGDPPVPAVNVAPTRGRPSSDTIVIFTGNATSWLSDAPTFTPTGVADVSIGSVSVVTDTQASAVITASTSTGTVTITDSTTDAATLFVVVGASARSPGIFA